MMDMPKSDAMARFDLRALRLLIAAVETRSITRGGEAVGMSQPAASRVMAGLRQTLGDPILVRTAEGFAATPRAERAAEDARRALEAAQIALAPADFDPATARRRVAVATTDYGLSTVIAPLLVLLANEAPGLAIACVPWTSTVPQDMERGLIDFALYADDDLPGDFVCRDLFEERYAVVARRGHPALFDARALSAASRIVVTYPEGRRIGRDDPLAETGAHGPVVLETPFFIAVDQIVGTSDAIACLPGRAARIGCASGVLSMREMTELPGFTYRLVWHRRLHKEPLSTWLRDAVVRATRHQR